ncbi:hypothetical protein N9N32_00450 [Alphaproteobacteria bacterium]|nr:hypothetical protein [Alphaproteobacteria bacterium]
MKFLLIVMSISGYGASEAKVIEFNNKAACHSYLKHKSTSYRMNRQNELTGILGLQVAVCTNNFDRPTWR